MISALKIENSPSHLCEFNDFDSQLIIPNLKYIDCISS